MGEKENKSIKRYADKESEVIGIRNNLEYLRDYLGLVLSDMINGFNDYSNLPDVRDAYKKLDKVCNNLYYNKI